MTLDSESRELIERLQNFEDRLITDEAIQETVLKSIENLKKIFGEDSIFSEILNRLKSRHNVEILEIAIKKSIEKTKTSIRSANAYAVFPMVGVHKNSILADFLADNNRISPKKLREIHNFFAKSSPILEEAFEKSNSNEVKEKLFEYIKILESEEDYLKRNINLMLGDAENTWSLYNLLNHEIAHWVFTELSRCRNTYFHPINEAYSFAIQKLTHTYDENYVFNRENLLDEIRQIYKLIVPRKYSYGKTNYKFS